MDEQAKSCTLKAVRVSGVPKGDEFYVRCMVIKKGTEDSRQIETKILHGLGDRRLPLWPDQTVYVAREAEAPDPALAETVRKTREEHARAAAAVIPPDDLVAEDKPIRAGDMVDPALWYKVGDMWARYMAERSNGPVYFLAWDGKDINTLMLDFADDVYPAKQKACRDAVEKKPSMPGFTGVEGQCGSCCPSCGEDALHWVMCACATSAACGQSAAAAKAVPALQCSECGLRVDVTTIISGTRELKDIGDA